MILLISYGMLGFSEREYTSRYTTITTLILDDWYSLIYFKVNSGEFMTI